MLFTTPGQVVILAVILLAGWLLGYASAPSAKMVQRKVRAQSDSFTAYHRDAEDKLRAATQRAADLKAENDALRADHADAERTIAALRGAAPVAAVPVSVAAEPVVETSAKRWFGSNGRDDLTRIQGIDGMLVTRLFGMGVVRFEDLEKLSDADALALEQRLGLPTGLIARDEWRTQARLLRAGNDAEHAALFGGAPVAGA